METALACLCTLKSSLLGVQLSGGKKKLAWQKHFKHSLSHSLEPNQTVHFCEEL